MISMVHSTSHNIQDVHRLSPSRSLNMRALVLFLRVTRQVSDNKMYLIAQVCLNPKKKLKADPKIN